MEKLFKMPNHYEPRKKMRFIVELPEEFDIKSYFVQSISRPAYDIKKNKWKEMSMSFVDPVVISTSERLFNMTKKKIKNFDVVIKGLDPTGVEIEKWTLTKCKMLDINFGHFNYQTVDEKKGGLVLPTIKFRPKKCMLS